jgi:SAM-dependent methyltransferase
MQAELFDQMYVLESRHWWFRAKRRIVLALLERSLGRPGAAGPRRVCDVGCGCGMMLAELAARGCDVAGIDASDKAVEYCARRGVRVIRGLLPDDAGRLPGRFDAVLMLDVLEHIERDRAALESALALLKGGGVLILTVPAFAWLWGRHDERHGHVRRYDLASLRKLLAGHAHARAEFVSYMNALLFPLALVSRLADGLAGARGASAELALPPPEANRLLEEVFASERHWLAAGGRFPFGLSLVAVLRVEGSVDISRLMREGSSLGLQEQER